MLRTDFPNYSQAASTGAVTAQNKYFKLVGIDLVSMIIASALSIYNYQAEESKQWFYVISGLLLLGSIVLTFLLKIKKYEEIWFHGRAMAEECKTLSWLYICRSKPFETEDAQTAQRAFRSAIVNIADRHRDLVKSLDPQIISRKLITPRMEEIRAMSLLERKDYYRKNRIESQILWYTEKAGYNMNKYNFWFWIIFFSQATSVISIIILIVRPSFEWNLVALFTTISATALSWLQTKKHQELSHSYLAAVDQLNVILYDIDDLNTEEEFSNFVLKSEGAISLEHNLWISRRQL